MTVFQEIAILTTLSLALQAGILLALVVQSILTFLILRRKQTRDTWTNPFQDGKLEPLSTHRDHGVGQLHPRRTS